MLTRNLEIGRHTKLIADVVTLVEEMRVEGNFLIGDGHFDYEKRGLDYHRGKQLLEDADKLEALITKRFMKRELNLGDCRRDGKYMAADTLPMSY